MKTNTLTFNLDNFVDREEDANQVRDAVKALKGNISSSQPKSIAFRGEIGIGKSWLLQYLRNDLAKDESIKVVYCDLKWYAGQDPFESVLEIMKLFVSVEDAKILGNSPSSASAVVIEKIQAGLKQKPLVVLLDHVYESDWGLLRTMEEYLLGPLAIESKTFFVMTGRGREYPWKTPELRLRAKFVDMIPLTLTQTKEQLKRISEQTEQNPEDIYGNSHGNPLANSLLINTSKEQFEQAIDHVLETIPESNRPKMRSYLEALCVLRYFDEERIPTMLKAYDPTIVSRDEYAQASQIRDELVKTAFARWDDEIGGFVMDKYWQSLLNKYLELHENKKWLKLHKAACDLYKRWVKDYPTAKKFWQVEIDYHEQILGDSQSGRKTNKK